MDSLQSLGQAVAELRRDRGLTQKQLGELSGLAQSSIARFETGSVAEFGARKLLRLLEILGHELAFKPKSASFTLDDALAERQRLEAAGDL
ncbi:helix-turn-helix transcriptional regulator [Aquabacterium sp.]|uniref:helix-turn-helix domain-containing protein n=1 Tax=Aquabacterium sp. TaxID=1872578 RepID=UPI0024893996|nr:helix-turn-helix transcriptional regulator [Aquabacterium sp.]MDI1259907.1 helix-turn-helix transcriptional regulator [Aquabacterium sp.]